MKQRLAEVPATESASAEVPTMEPTSAEVPTVKPVPTEAPSPAAVPIENPSPETTRALFANPPAGFGEVPFWWWTGDPLDRERLKWQIEQLHQNGVAGMQVNYAHQDTPGWPTYPNQPEIFSPEWWDFWEFAVSECKKRGMSLGLSTYTLDWQKSRNLFAERVYNDPRFHAMRLQGHKCHACQPGSRPEIRLEPSEHSLGFWAYPYFNGKLAGAGVPITNETLNVVLSQWSGNASALPQAPQLPLDEIQIWEFTWEKQPGTLNPLHPEAGKRVLEQFYEPFLQHNGGSAEGLNWFFNDELKVGVETGEIAWIEDFPEAFQKAKGWSLFDYMPALFQDEGGWTAKVRMDCADVRLTLTEERFFKPIFEWHHSRGLIFGCDNNGRGLHPTEYVDYMRIVRWYSAPGHDTPGGKADFIKGKVSSSIANLNERPRVWLEGYHSLGWGATPNDLMEATNENFVYGCTLLNLHGLYYTTHGSFWEWAPPCYHFRMPYWEHFGGFLKYFERLSWLLSQGVWQSEIAILYPTAPSMAGLDANQRQATETAFAAARKIYSTARDITFLDDASLLRAEVKDGRLHVGKMAFSVCVLPGLEAIRWDVLQKLLEFQRQGGTLLCLERQPKFSDHAFGEKATEELARAVKNLEPLDQAQFDARIETLPQDVRLETPDGGTLKCLHRRVGRQEVYFLMGVRKGALLSFRATGSAELWDAMTGTRRDLPILTQNTERTTLACPVQANQAALVVFTPGEKLTLALPNPWYAAFARRLEGPWNFQLKPTMDNRWGDFRLPVTPENRVIGAEARRFRYHVGEVTPEMLASEFDDSGWERVTSGFGPQFRLVRLEKPLDDVPAIRQQTQENSVPYAFSWRWGVEGNPGHQGWHGLKEQLDDRFIALGAPREGQNETLLVEENPPRVYCLTTFVRHAGKVRIERGGNLPARVWLDGKPLAPETTELTLDGTAQELILEYTTAGRGWWFFEKVGVPASASRTPLAMTWYDRPFVPFESQPQRVSAVYRFKAPPGLKRLKFTLDDRAAEAIATKAAALSVFVDGTKHPLRLTGNLGTVELPQAVQKHAIVALQAELPPGIEGGTLFPEPIRLDTEVGVIDSLGDWAQDGSVLENYSGGAVYSKEFTLSPEELTVLNAAPRVVLSLGEVHATAAVRLNGELMGTLVAAPWELDVTGKLRAGENRLEIDVRNTLANHFLTIPTRYRGSTVSGLIGPVEIRTDE